METDLFPSNKCRIVYSEYSVIKSDVIKSFDCTFFLQICNIFVATLHFY